MEQTSGNGTDAVRLVGAPARNDLHLRAFHRDLLAGDGPEWWADASCAQADPEAFFPEKGGTNREAKRICRSCPVRQECLEHALTHDERFGIWGGKTERERRRMQPQ